MKYLLLSFLLLMGGIMKGQNYNDLFTTYKDVNPQQNNGVTQYETLDPNQFIPTGRFNCMGK